MNDKLTHGDFPVESQRYGTSARYCIPAERSDWEELQEYKRVLHPKRMEQIIALWKQATGETVQPDLDTLMVWLVKQAQGVK